jgi:hypothetical protein
MSIWIFFYVKLEHGVTLVDAPLLLDEGFGLEEVSQKKVGIFEVLYRLFLSNKN